MAVLTAQGISSLSVALLTRSLVLPMTVSRISGGEFSGDNGDTITVRVPQPGSARTQATPGATITYDDVTEIPVDVSLSHLYHGKLVSDEELSLDLVDFGRQITRIQVDAVATGAEDELAGAMNGLTADASFDLSASAANTEASILAAREALSSADAPNGDRWFVVSPDIATRILSVDKFVRVDASGSDSALRQAIIGRLYGFNFVESNALTAGTALAYHMSGFAFANRVPVTPRGANQSATANKDGIGLRHIFQYVPDVLSDASVVSTFAGAAPVADDGTGTNGTSFPRVYKFDTATA